MLIPEWKRELVGSHTSLLGNRKVLVKGGWEGISAGVWKRRGRGNWLSPPWGPDEFGAWTLGGVDVCHST